MPTGARGRTTQHSPLVNVRGRPIGLLTDINCLCAPRSRDTFVFDASSGTLNVMERNEPSAVGLGLRTAHRCVAWAWRSRGASAVRRRMPRQSWPRSGASRAKASRLRPSAVAHTAVVLLLVAGCTRISTPTQPPSASTASTATPIPVLATGRTFFIAPDGSDSADGSLTTPRRTLLAASRLLAPGDTLLVRGGTYRDPGGYDWASTGSGTSSAPITVKAYPGEIPVFDGGATEPATGFDDHAQIAIILRGVSYLSFEDLTFIHFDPFDNGIFVVESSDHVSFRRITGYDQYTDSDTEHYFYVSHSSEVLIEGCNLDGIAGAAVHIYSSDYTVGSGAVSSRMVTVRDSRLTNNGHWGILAGSGLDGGQFLDNFITSKSVGVEFNSPTTSVTMSGNTIAARIGIFTNLTAYGGYGPAAESNDCLDSPIPFKVGWPGDAWTLVQWQAAGLGAGTVVGSCSP
jgi:hypothetical protein